MRSEIILLASVLQGVKNWAFSFSLLSVTSINSLENSPRSAFLAEFNFLWLELNFPKVTIPSIVALEKLRQLALHFGVKGNKS